MTTTTPGPLGLGPVPPEVFQEAPEEFDRDIYVNLLDLNALGRFKRDPLPSRAFTWGFTILRTVYTLESDTAFPIAVETLRRWMVHWARIEAFQASYDPSPRPYRTEPSEEIAARIWNEVVEDRERLDGASWETVHNVFEAWLHSQGVDQERSLKRMPSNPRLNSCMVIDAAALAALQTMPETPPNLSSPPTKEEYDWSVSIAARDAWVWIYDLKPQYLLSQGRDEPVYQGWLRVAPHSLCYYWFMRIALDGSKTMGALKWY